MRLPKMPPREEERLRADAAEQQNKRFRKAIDEMADELVCPITQELPVDPVTAADGHVYERDAIESWFRRLSSATSPVTREPMAKQLLPAVQVRNLLVGMVGSGALDGTKADAWQARLAERTAAKARRRIVWAPGFFYPCVLWPAEVLDDYGATCRLRFFDASHVEEWKEATRDASVLKAFDASQKRKAPFGTDFGKIKHQAMVWRYLKAVKAADAAQRSGAEGAP